MTVGRAFWVFALVGSAQAAWILQDTHSTAGLRGIHNLGNGIAWASGTGGTVLRTTDGGQTWQACAVPPDAAKLDFRAVQAFDANSAIVMSAGTGDLSRLYKTTDGCRSWRLIFSNPDKQGFWDGLQFSGPEFGALIGDPVSGRFPVFITTDRGETWKRQEIDAAKNQSLFAASNTSLRIGDDRTLYVVTGGGTTAIIAEGVSSRLPLAEGEAAGAFSLGMRKAGGKLILVAVGGDYKLPDETAGTAANRDAEGVWHAAEAPPHGYRSAVAYDAASKSWIAVGTNGTDISMDDGRNWKPVPESQTGWNALSLPFAAGSKGRIAKWQP
jgi:photosystem II stability/assembly factor-like uncharacterized protein